MEEQTQESKKDMFQKYLDQTGIIDELTKVLVGLYEESDKPNNGVEYLKKYFGRDNDIDVKRMQNDYQRLLDENTQLRQRVKELESQLKLEKESQSI